MADGDVFITKLEKGPMDRFKNRNMVLEKFGEQGTDIYDAIGKGISANQLASSLQIEEETLVQVLEFLEQKKIISVGAAKEGKEEQESKKQPVKKQALYKRRAGQQQDLAWEEKSETQSQEPEPEAKEATEGQEGVGEDKLIKPHFEAQEPAYLEPEASSRQARRKEPKGLQEMAESKSEEEEEKAAQEAKGDSGGPGGQEGLENEGSDELKYGREDEEESSKQQDEGQEGSIETPSQQEKEMEQNLQMQQSDLQSQELSKYSPIEKIIFNKFGKTGVLVYTLIDGEKTAEEIMLETGLSEIKLVEILEFMENQGIIKLEKPAAEGGSGGAGGGPGEPSAPDSPDEDKDGATDAGGPESEDSESKSPFHPFVEQDTGALVAPENVSTLPEFADIVPIDVPISAPANPISQTALKAQLFLKFKAHGNSVLALVDGKNDTIAISLSTRLSLEQVDDILGFLGMHKAVYFKPLSRDEIKNKYGEDGLAIYKKFGREGVILYELIGKEQSIKEIIIRSKVEPKHAVDIVLFIHTLLGIDIPLTRDVLFKQLGIQS
ncbi:hypothetical protein FJZ26_03080 [Candidatus Parvarchaeota archaeon]|nr:hypothetical protein [Candidatus Parvarchaeota archaeon]